MNDQEILMLLLPALHQQMLFAAIDAYSDSAFETYCVYPEDSDKALAMQQLLQRVKATPIEAVPALDVVAVSQAAQHWTSA